MSPINEISILDLNLEEKRNLMGFLELLLKVDKRKNPHLYASGRGVSPVPSNLLFLDGEELQHRV
jgi:hypothetical protein